MSKKLRYWVVGLIISPFLLYKGFQVYETRYSAGYFPEPIRIGKALVREPGCDLFWCNGGSIFRISSRQSQIIKAGGVDYLNNLPSQGRNERYIDEWVSSKESERPRRLYFSSNRKSKHKSQMRLAIREQECFVSGTDEPLLIICPDVKLAYMGWFD